MNSGDLGDKFVICGDLNCLGQVGTRGLVNEELQKLIEEHSLTQHVQEATCRTGNILDHILTPDNKAVVRSTEVHDIGLSDHSLITCELMEFVYKAPISTSIFRCWKRLDTDRFKKSIVSSSIYQNPAETANSFAAQIETDISKILDKLLPVHKITRRVGKSTNKWLSEEAIRAKQQRRRLE